MADTSFFKTSTAPQEYTDASTSADEAAASAAAAAADRVATEAARDAALAALNDEAASITVAPAGTIASTNVQAALEELDGDVQALDAATTAALATKADDAATTAALATKADDAATTAALATKAPLASPALTGAPTAPTPADGDNSTKIATTGFVQSAFTLLKNGVSSAFDTLSEIATAIGLKADIASPGLTGTPTAPTAAVDTNTTQLATTAFVLGQAASVAPSMDGVAAVGTSTRYARRDHIHPSDTAKADASTVTALASKFPTSTTGNLAKYADTAGALADTGIAVGSSNQLTIPGLITVSVTIADDGLTSIAIPGGTTAAVAWTVNTTPGTTRPCGVVYARVAAAAAPVFTASDATNVMGATTNLSTLADITDGKLGFGSPGDGTLYIRNRLGASIAFRFTVIVSG